MFDGYNVQDIRYKVYIGVYFLFYHGTLIYVGVTSDLNHRLRQHRQSGKTWDAVKFIEEMDYYKAIQIENSFLEQHRPRLNKDIRGKLWHHEHINGTSAPYDKENYPGGWPRH